MRIHLHNFQLTANGASQSAFSIMWAVDELLPGQQRSVPLRPLVSGLARGMQHCRTELRYHVWGLTPYHTVGSAQSESGPS